MTTLHQPSQNCFLKIFTVLLLVITGLIPDAQAQQNKWIVDDLSGNIYQIDFSTATPTVTLASSAGSGGTEDINNMTDASNNFLFSLLANSSSNIKVMDATFATMPNGNGLNGNNSSMQSNIIPRPCTGDQYYLVHFAAATHKLYYSIVDMSMNGGLGDVSSKNILT